MTITTENPRLNGVDTATLFATLDAVKGQNEIAKFQFRASNTWVNGTHSQSTVSGFFGATQEMQHKQAASEPAEVAQFLSRMVSTRPESGIEVIGCGDKGLALEVPDAT